ncbi:hypothetical protein [Paramicrobacterium chengjingii]|uniref:Uncharacterized protein n=1 Tax=Paramicrobacterium chengjingii TaxID=2769067 RepID=A0ABX6YMC7_9MICO|nr:hypothetical protein [Microbacterium chengjingii]QPZ39959.1 hypothetical protein HCR76_08070 [Microbacterium chengjingii]
MKIGRVIAVCLLTIAFGALLWLLGLAPSFAVAFGLLVPVIALLWACRADNDSAPWGPAEPYRGVGARQDISRLAWALRSTQGRVGDTARKRVRAVAAHRLERIGLHLDEPADEPAIIAAIGERAFAVVAPSSLTRCDRTDVDVALSRLSEPLKKESQ